jgi:hypothetical protein
MLAFRASLLALAALITITSCGSPNNDDGSANAEELRLCQDICLKPFCDPTLEPDGDVDDACMDTCSTRVEKAAELACSEQHSSLLECLDTLTCEEFYLWVGQMPGLPCMAQEQLLADECPSIEVRVEGD